METMHPHSFLHAIESATHWRDDLIIVIRQIRYKINA